MNTAGKISEVRSILSGIKMNGKRIGFVPTMGFLHKGHLSLVELSKKHSDFQVMSIFVNKIQFNDKHDFNNYPRDIERDLDLAKKGGVDLVFIPEDEEMYNERLTYVDVETLTEHLCGAHRKGHFRGVFTVVSKLFNILQPDVAVFGQKDIQQAVCIEKMVRDLDFPVKIIFGPIIREEDGLAMSSRNKHLNPEQRKSSLSIYWSLKKAEELIKAGEHNSAAIIEQMKKIIFESKPDKIDYITIAGYHNLAPVDRLRDKSVIAVAVFFGSTRLIDNMIIEKNNGSYRCIL